MLRVQTQESGTWEKRCHWDDRVRVAPVSRRVGGAFTKLDLVAPTAKFRSLDRPAALGFRHLLRWFCEVTFGPDMDFRSVTPDRGTGRLRRLVAGGDFLAFPPHGAPKYTGPACVTDPL